MRRSSPRFDAPASGWRTAYASAVRSTASSSAAPMRTPAPSASKNSISNEAGWPAVACTHGEPRTRHCPASAPGAIARAGKGEPPMCSPRSITETR